MRRSLWQIDAKGVFYSDFAKLQYADSSTSGSQGIDRFSY
jgi:hypothetical protein